MQTGGESFDLGVDEAGLGPTLGPLVIGAFASVGPRDLLGALGEVVTRPDPRSDAIEIGASNKMPSRNLRRRFAGKKISRVLPGKIVR